MIYDRKQAIRDISSVVYFFTQGENVLPLTPRVYETGDFKFVDSPFSFTNGNLRYDYGNEPHIVYNGVVHTPGSFDVGSPVGKKLLELALKIDEKFAV